MGQGYSITTLSAGSAGIDVPELSDLVYERSMGGGRFMKSIRARQQNGLVFVKVIMKPYPTMQLEKYVKAIARAFQHIEAIGLELISIIDRGTQALDRRAKRIELRTYLRNREWRLSGSSIYSQLSLRPYEVCLNSLSLVLEDTSLS